MAQVTSSLHIWSVLLLTVLLTLTACAPTEEPATYPISGETCGPDDPVKTLDAQDCVVTNPGVL